MSQIDPNMIALIVALLINVPTWYMLRASKAKATNEAKSLEDEITDRVLERADKEMAKMQKQLDAEIVSRAADKIQYEAEITQLRNELHTERSARGLLEGKLIEAQQRISALEDELSKREKRIRELEGNSGTFPAAKPHGFK